MPGCPRCGAELASGDPAGLCPMCLIQGALGSSGAGEFNTRTAGSAAEVAPDEDFGCYRIVQLLGEGVTGLGVVLLGLQLCHGKMATINAVVAREHTTRKTSNLVKGQQLFIIHSPIMMGTPRLFCHGSCPAEQMRFSVGYRPFACKFSELHYIKPARYWLRCVYPLHCNRYGLDSVRQQFG